MEPSFAARRLALLCDGLSLAEGRPDAAGGGDPFADAPRWALIASAAMLAGLMPAVADRLAPHCDQGPRARLPTADVTAAELLLRDHLAGFRARRLAHWLCLAEVVRALNGKGVEPLLTGSARAIWLETPSWHYARDLALLVPADRMAGAATALAAARFEKVASLDRSVYRRRSCWIRADMSGWITLLAEGTSPRIEALLPASDLYREARTARAMGATARVLASDLEILHTLLERDPPQPWSGSWPFTRGASPLVIKPVYEFACSIRALNASERDRLHARARRDRRLGDALGDWLATAHRHLALTVPAPLDRAVEGHPGRPLALH